ncbi:DUF1003 domain-containing protein [Dermacoccus nishinomiyaensis]
MSREVGSRRERARDEKRDERRDAKESREESRRKEALKEARRDSRDERDAAGRLDQPQEKRARVLPRIDLDSEGFGVASEKFARYMGTANFLILMSGFIIIYVVVNMTPLKFDEYPFVFLTLLLSLQASYAAPLILLAQNRQDDRDRVAIEQDRSRDERNLADTEFLTREVASLRLAMRETATRDFVRSELRSLLEEMEERGMLATPDAEDDDAGSSKKEKKAAKKQARKDTRPEA